MLLAQCSREAGGGGERWEAGTGTASGELGILGSSGASPSGTDTCRGGQHIPGSTGAETPRKPKPGTGGSDSHGIPWERSCLGSAELVQFSMSIFQNSESISPCPWSAFHLRKTLVPTAEIPTVSREFEALQHP